MLKVQCKLPFTFFIEQNITAIKAKIDDFSFQYNNIIDYVNLLYMIKYLCSLNEISQEQKRRPIQSELEIINKLKNWTEIQLEIREHQM